MTNKQEFAVADWYTQHATAYAGTWDQVACPQLISFCALLPENSKIADIACGSGRDLMAGTALGHNMFGTDISEGQVTQSLTHHEQVQVASFDRLPYADNSMDGVWAKAAIVHSTVTQTTAGLREWLRVSKPGALLHVDAKLCDGSVDGDGFDPSGRWFQFLTPEELSQLVTDAGWIVEARSIVDDTVRDFIKWSEVLARKPL